MQIRTSKRSCFASTRTVVVKKKKKKILMNIGKDMEKLEPSYTAVGIVKQ